MNLLRNNRGATAVEFALVALPVLLFILGIMQVGFIVWTDNLLHFAVDATARCAAVKSTTLPCNNNPPTLTNMQTTANQIFAPLSGATFSLNNTNCSGDNGIGLVGTYKIKFLFTVNLTLTANSCYPIVS
jgi:Flp pilus assembly protein TadG